MNRLIARSRDEEGAVLLIALAFLTFIGVVASILLTYATTSMRDTAGLRDIRGREYAADGVVDAAINKIRGSFALSNLTCLAPTTLNGVSLRVDCTDTGVPAGVDVTFTACPTSNPLPSCPNEQRLVARVHYNRSVPAPAPLTVNAWSLRR